MFGKKKEEEISKKIESVPDPSTGETIHRYSVPPQIQKDIQKAINEHSGNMNQFVQNSVTFFDLLDFQIELKKKVKIADNNVKVSMQKAMKDCKLDPKLPFAWNLLLSCFEYRTAPIVPGMSDAEIVASNNPARKPNIVDTPGIAVK